MTTTLYAEKARQWQDPKEYYYDKVFLFTGAGPVSGLL